jgi:hypothetical protein
MALTQVSSNGISKPVDLADDEKVRLGTGDDLEIFHGSNISTIKDSNSDLRIMSDTIRIQRAAGGENFLYMAEGGTVRLHYDGTETFATKSGGNTLTGTDASGNVSLGRFYFKTEGGTVRALFDPLAQKFQHYDNTNATFGNDHDLSIYHDSSNSSIVNATGVFTIKNSGAGKLQLMTQGAQDVEIKTNNELSIKCIDDGAVELYHDGTKQFETSANGLAFPSGKGIDFSATSDAGGNSSELLDDYEEGTWTPSLKFGGNFNGSYSTQTGYYTRVGRLVTFSFRITLTSKGSNTGNAQVFGLPFNVKGNDAAYSAATFGWLQNMANLQRWVCTQIPTLDTNASYIYLRRFETNLGATAVPHQHDSFSDSSDFIMQGLYVAD